MSWEFRRHFGIASEEMEIGVHVDALCVAELCRCLMPCELGHTSIATSFLFPSSSSSNVQMGVQKAEGSSIMPV